MPVRILFGLRWFPFLRNGGKQSQAQSLHICSVHTCSVHWERCRRQYEVVLCSTEMLQRIELGFVLRGYMKLQEQGGQEPRNLSSNLVTLGKS